MLFPFSRPPIQYRIAALIALYVVTLPLHAQVYKWTDADGRIHYGDRPPPEARSERLQTGPAPSGAAVRAQERATEIIRREAGILASDRAREEAVVARREAREREIAAAYSEYCRTSRNELRILNSGGGVYYEDDAGERVFISDEDRNVRIAALRAGIAEHCN